MPGTRAVGVFKWPKSVDSQAGMVTGRSLVLLSDNLDSLLVTVLILDVRCS